MERIAMDVRYPPLLLALVIAVLGGFNLGGADGRAAPLIQRTPAAPGISGVAVETLGHGPSSVAPGYTLQLIRLTFAPGGRIAMHHHPGDAVFYVESGEIGWTTGSGTALLSRAQGGPPNAAATPDPEPLGAGPEVLLHAGDAVFYDQDVTHDVRNPGAEPAVVLYAALRAGDQPGITFTEATPAT
jgi:quercetin dioxygenase-like cupin family protein